MKHLKSSIHSLQQLFKHGIALRVIAEPLASFDAESPSDQVRIFLDAHDYDVIGIRMQGLITAYATRAGLRDGSLRDYAQAFDPKHLLNESDPLLEVFSILRDTPAVFVRFAGHVSGIVTRGDLQKAPVRMWLFGLVTLIEMQMLRLIRDMYPNNQWRIYLSEGRLEAARKVLTERQQRNEAIDLADCLQFSDKRDIVLKSTRLRQALTFASKSEGQQLLKDLERLRNNLAHAQDIVGNDWPHLVVLAKQAQNLLEQCEAIGGVSLDDPRQEVM
jgi:hypothetical protein